LEKYIGFILTVDAAGCCKMEYKFMDPELLFVIGHGIISVIMSYAK
jgi:hypothetical protein